jgi:hypothetical protein
MSAFDMQVNVMAIGVSAPTEEEQQQGRTQLDVVLTLAQLFPTPQGQAMPIPLGTVRFPLGGEDAINVGRQFIEEGEKLPKTSDIQIASDIKGVEQIAKADQAFRGGPQ